MKKTKKIWLVIVCIVLVGSAVTFYTQNFITEKKTGDSLQAVEVLQLEKETGAELGEWKKERVFEEESAIEVYDGIAAPGSSADKPVDERNWKAYSEAETHEYMVKETMGATESGTKSASEPDSAVAERAAGVAAFIVEEETVKNEAQEHTGAMADKERKESASIESLESPEQSTETERFVNVAGASANSANAKIEIKDATPSEGNMMISPLTGNVESNVQKAETVSYEEERIRLSGRIADLETQIAARWKNDTDETMTSKMTAAEYEYSLWENEMVQTMKLLEKVLDEEAYEQLTKAQTNWKKTRETHAAASASKFQGSSRESLEYTKASSTLTRTRALQLINTYLEILQELEAENTGK